MDEGRWTDGPLKGRRDRVGKVDFKGFILVVRRRALR